MKICKSNNELITLINNHKENNKNIGFVPTMGALHSGHLSLVNKSVLENDYTVVSVFVNKLQFNDDYDYNNYPREIETDIKLLNNINNIIIYIPTHKDIYGDFEIRNFNLGEIDTMLEGKFRSGHFNGVANVVYRLFSIVQPHKAYFGKKDYQQIFVIKEMLKQTKLPVNIIECDIVRETDGLAKSSRNVRLSKTERKHALLLSQTLKKVKEKAKINNFSELKTWAENQIKEDTILKLEYFEFVDLDGFRLIENDCRKRNIIACIAVYAGKVRLIDNINIYL